MLTVLATAAAAFVVVLWAIPATWLLPIALAVTALVPVGRLPLPEFVTVLSPGALVVLVWALRREHQAKRRPPAVVTVVCAAVAVLLVVGTLTSMSTQRSFGWGATFVLLVLVPAVGYRLPSAEAARLLDTWVWLAAGLAVFGMIERLLGANPVYGGVFAGGDFPIVQYWSDYRVTTTLGHPLHNALFFAAGTVIAVGRFVERGRTSTLLAAALGLVGVFLTISRGGIVAVAVGVAIVAIGPVLRSASAVRASRANARGLLALAAVGAGLAAVATSPVFQERLQSSNGIASARARDELGPLVWSVSEQLGHLGSGPGTSNALLEARGTPTVIENSWFQLLLSLGLPGALLVAVLVAAAAWTALRTGSLSAAAGLAAISTSAAGFNWIESNRPGMLFLGLLVAAALSASERDTGSSETGGLSRATATPPFPRQTPGTLSAGIAAGSDASRNSVSRSGSPGSSIAEAARRNANSARSTPRFGLCDHGTGPAPRQPAFRSASSPRWYPTRA